MKVAYTRVSTVEQNVQRQFKAMEALAIEKYFKEKASAKDTNRPKLTVNCQLEIYLKNKIQEM